MFDPTNVTREMNTLIAKRGFNEMLGVSERIIDENPIKYLGYWWKARTYTLMGDTDSALDCLMEAMKRAEDEFEESKISSSMANVYNIRKDWEESLNYTDIALELNPENVVAIIARSIALMATGNRKEATTLLDRNEKLFNETYQKACVAAIKREKAKMLGYLSEVFEKNPHNRVTVLHDPDFSLYWRDPEFRALLKV